MKEINLLGNGGISRIASEIIQNYLPDYKVCLHDDNISLHGTLVNQVEVKGSILEFVNMADRNTYFLNCIGNINAFKNRINYSLGLKIKGAQAISIIHPSVIISDTAKLGSGVFICPNVVINTNAVLGDENIIFSNVVIEHDSKIGNLCYFSPSSTLCGKVIVEDRVYIGPNAVITAGVHIGKNAIIGAGAVVLNDVPANTVYVGNPAKFLKPNSLWNEM